MAEVKAVLFFLEALVEFLSCSGKLYKAVNVTFTKSFYCR